ncbi:MAG TPA: cysteine dioxygenase family protein [Mycobacteriales bacterium]|nr:cysteine dioxygenase family protein [Mycobacteriales bacterium]
MPTLAGLSLSELIDLVRNTAADSEQWRQHVRFDPVSRYFHLLRSDDVVDIWLLTWLPGQATDLHDHGGSAAAIQVVQGNLHERHADHSGRLDDHSLALGSTHWLAPDAVHDVYNVDAPPAVSIHAYSPPLRSMTFYQPVAGGLEPLRTVPTREPEVSL